MNEKQNLEELFTLNLLADGTCAISAKKVFSAIAFMNGETENVTLVGENSATKIVIPSEWDGNRITHINLNGFENCVYLKEIVISEGIKTIGVGAFRGCRALTSVKIPSSVTRVGEEAFYECNSLKSVTIPDGVECIEDYTFFNCTSLTDIAIPDSVTYIGDYAFSHCDELVSVSIPSDVKKLGEGTFYKCSKLNKVRLKEGIEKIGDGCFVGCRKLEFINIPETLKEIESEAFEECYNLRYVNIKSLDSWLNICFSDSISNPLMYSKHLYIDSNIVENLDLSNCKIVNKYAFSGGEFRQIKISSRTLLGEHCFYRVKCQDFVLEEFYGCYQIAVESSNWSLTASPFDDMKFDLFKYNNESYYMPETAEVLFKDYLDLIKY